MERVVIFRKIGGYLAFDSKEPKKREG